MKNELYWAYNLPLQIWPSDDGKDARVLNYMPRKERVEMFKLSELLGEETREEFFESAAIHFENLARLFREAKSNPDATIYYHDKGIWNNDD